MFILAVLLSVSIILESSITTIPLVLILLINFAVASRKTSVFIVAFLCGLLLDILLGNNPGVTSFYFVTLISIIYLYQRSFDIQTFPFVFISTFIGSFLYLMIGESRFVLAEAILSSVISVIFFWLIIQADRLHIRTPRLGYER
jgi:cell shape-determining protein MreD